MQTYSRWSNIRTSFQFKLFLIFSLLTFLITSLLSVAYTLNEIQENKRVATEHLQLRAQQLADSVRLPLYAGNSEVLHQLADQASHLPEIHTVVITAPDGKVLAEVHSNSHPADPTIISQTAGVYSSNLVNSIEASFTGSTVDKTSLIGEVRMDRDTHDLSRSVWKLAVISSSLAVLFWLLVSLLCFLVLRRVTGSFNALIHGISAMHGGNFSSRIDITSHDEPGRAAQAVNKLADALEQRGAENNRLQKERLELERQMLHSQKLESLGIMAGGIAHDYNNLLQSILGNIELAAVHLQSDSAPAKFIANALNSGKHAAHLTNMMLTYVGKGYIDKKALNLNELVIGNAEMLRTAASSSVGIDLNLSDDLPVIMADEANIQQVVMNLIINAAESIAVQPGVIVLSTGVQELGQTALAASLVDEKPAPGRFVFVEISDNGCGMSAETVLRLFDPFFTTKFTGRGLGMSAVIGIMRSHCGALFVESEVGKGTTFRALFPAPEALGQAMEQTNEALPPLEPQPQQQQTTSAESPPASGVVLVVDDEKPVLRICKKMVELCGYHVITATDGVDAVAKFTSHADEITIVVMDLTMPNMDGITAMEKIYGLRPDTKVIISSGFNEEELSEKLNSRNPAGFIRKPYSMSVLEAELRKVMQPE